MWTQVQDALSQSATRVLTGAARLLPGTIALVVAVLVAAAIGWLVGAILKRALRGVDFDQRLAQWGWFELPEWTASRSPAALVARVVEWAIIVGGFIIGLAAFDATLTSELMLRLFGSAMNLFTALVLLVIGNILARFLARSVLISLVNMNVQQARLVSLGVKWVVLVVTAAMALDHLSIGGRIVDLAFGILFGGIVLALSLAIGLGSKDLVSRSLARQADKAPEEPSTEPFRHL